MTAQQRRQQQPLKEQKKGKQEKKNWNLYFGNRQLRFKHTIPPFKANNAIVVVVAERNKRRTTFECRQSENMVRSGAMENPKRKLTKNEIEKMTRKWKSSKKKKKLQDFVHSPECFVKIEVISWTSTFFQQQKRKWLDDAQGDSPNGQPCRWLLLLFRVYARSDERISNADLASRHTDDRLCNNREKVNSDELDGDGWRLFGICC